MSRGNESIKKSLKINMFGGGVVPKLEPVQFPYFGVGKGAARAGCLINDLK